MHDSVIQWVRWKIEEYGLTHKNVIELGSRNVNGSVREYFGATSYVGVDMIAGNNVDLVTSAHDLPFEAETFDICVCCEMLEHDLFFWQSLTEAFRVLEKGGHLLLTCRGIGFPEHSYPDDFYRFTPSAITEMLKFIGYDIIMVERDSEYEGVFAHAARS